MKLPPQRNTPHDGRIVFAATIALILLAALWVLLVPCACQCRGAELLDFTATWCQPCQRMQPVIDQLRARGYTVHQIDFDARQDLVAQYRVASIPTFIVTENGRELTRHVGATTFDHLVQLLTRPPRAPAGRSYFRMRGAFPPEFLQRAEARANQCRRELALTWLGAELPEWDAPADVKLVPAAGSGGATSFVWNQGRASQFSGTWQGTEQGLLADVIPHEVLHTVFATHFRRPVPRWADEGAATYTETDAPKQIYRSVLIDALTHRKAFPTAQLCAYSEYPPDYSTFYAQSTSLAAFLIEHNGPQGFVAFLESTHSTPGGLDAALAAHYEIADQNQLQVDWLSWVQAGSPRPAAEVAYRGRPCPCYRWRPLKRLWERRPGFIIPRRGQPAAHPPAAAPVAPSIAATPAPASPPVRQPATDPMPPLVELGSSSAEPPPPPNEPPGADPIAAAPGANDEAADGPDREGLIARIKAQADAAREKLRAHFEERIAKLRGQHADELQSRDQANEDLRAQLDQQRDEATTLRDKLAHAVATVKNLEREIATKGPEAAAGAIASRSVKSLLITLGLGNIPAALIATAAGFFVRRKIKQLRAKLHTSQSQVDAQSGIINRLQARIHNRPSPPPVAPVDRPSPETASPAETAAPVTDQAEPSPPPAPAQPEQTVKVIFEGLLDKFPNDAAKDFARNLVSHGKNIFHEVFVCQLYREAVDLAEKGDPQIATLGGPNVATAIRTWVYTEFARRAGVK